MAYPPGLEEYDTDGNIYVLEVPGNLYGRKDAGAVYEQAFSKWMIEKEGFTRSPHDPALYTRKLGTREEVCLTAYVDDCIWHAGSTQAATAFSKAMDKKWGDMGTKPASYVLGLNVKTVQERSGRKHLRISAEENIRRVSEKFLHTELGPATKRRRNAMTDTTEADQRQVTHATVSTPFRPGEVVDLLDCLPEGEKSQVDYRGLVGSLQWLATTCRPDIAFCVSQLARVQARPGPRHWAMALNVAKYLEQTAEQGIWYSQQTEKERGRIHGYCDASWADTPGYVSETPDPNGYKSTGGHVVYLNGGAISWASRTQTITALSSTESELYATRDAAKDITH
jgi:KUP system potassium uptake protein